MFCLDIDGLLFLRYTILVFLQINPLDLCPGPKYLHLILPWGLSQTGELLLFSLQLGFPDYQCHSDPSPVSD